MHLNKIGEVNVVLQECIEIFKEQMEKEAKAGRDIILDEYRPAEGDYIIVKKDGSLMSCSIKEDKKKKTLEGINESDFLYRDICFYDYHSRLISMDKPQDSKKIVHSNNYMSFWVKYESFDNGKLDVQAIDRYFDVLINPREKYKNADRVMYDFIYQQIGDVDTQQLESNRKWIKENIFQLDKTELNLPKKKYLKIFFEDDRDTYIREEKRYVMTKIYNKNDYNIEINNNMYGLPNDNLGLNSKKPYLEHKTRKLPVPNLIDVKQVLLQRKFFDFLANKANAGLTNVFFENESREITAYPNGEFEKGDIYGSDKALKYPMKKMWNDEGKKVLYIKSMRFSDGTLIPKTLKERYEELFEVDDLKDCKDSKEVLGNLMSAVDVKNFGATFAEAKNNFSITGAVQFGQGFNKYSDTSIEEQNILSPFRDGKKKEGDNGKSEEARNTTLGTKIVCDEAHYFYPFVINPLAYKEMQELGIKNSEYTQEDYENFKRTAIVSATAFATNSKEGCENEFAIFVETDAKLYLPNFTEYITFEKGEELNIINISKLSEILNEVADRIKDVEIYYNPYTTELISGINNEKRYNIVTQKEV